MRKNLKKKIIATVERLGPTLFKDFDNIKEIRRKKLESAAGESVGSGNIALKTYKNEL